ncbi:MAG: hypothetical protein NVS4B8_15960 [Herpetosiphon sp.]
MVDTIPTDDWNVKETGQRTCKLKGRHAQRRRYVPPTSLRNSSSTVLFKLASNCGARPRRTKLAAACSVSSRR